MFRLPGGFAYSVETCNSLTQLHTTNAFHVPHKSGLP